MRGNLILKVTIILLAVLSNPGNLSAEVRSGNSVTIPSDEVIDDDLYIFAQAIVVDGTVKGDLIAFGQQIKINGTIEGDLIAAAQEIVVNGNVSDDVRFSGQVLKLDSETIIGDDLIAAGYSLECADQSSIDGELKFAGFQSVLAGNVKKKVELASANCELSGEFGDDVVANVESSSDATGAWGAEYPAVASGLTVTESATIAGDLIYTSTREAEIDPNANIVGEIDSTIESVASPTLTLTERVVIFAKQYLAMVVVGLLVIFCCPKWTGDVVNNVQKRPLASLGWGVLALVSVIFGIILLLVATIAIAILLGYASLENLRPPWVALGSLTTAGVLITFLVFVNWVSKIIVSAWAGNRIIHGPAWSSNRRFLSLLLGVFIFSALVLIPYVGSVISLTVTLIGIGSTTLWMFGAGKKPAPEKPLV